MSDHKTTHTNHNKAVPYDTQPTGLEKWLDEMYAKLPIQFPPEARKWLPQKAWGLAALGGVLTLWGLWSIWQMAHYADGMAKWANELSKTYGGTPVSNDLGVMWWLGLGVMAAQAVVLLLAVSPLKQLKKAGWNLLFYSSLLSLVGSVLAVVGSVVGNLVGGLVGAFIGWLILFQVRKEFHK